MTKFIFLLVGSLSSALIMAENSTEYVDERIKKIIKPTENIKDLQNFGKIKISDYVLKDFHEHGTTIRKGLTAQQIEKILPDAVFNKKSLIPNVYSLAKSVKIVDERTHIESKMPHEFKANDTIKIIIKDQGGAIFKVSSVLSKTKFSVNSVIEATANQIFIYGKEVDDLRQIDYRALSILHMSATQALQKIIQRLAVKNYELEIINKNFSERLTDLENLLAKSIATEATSEQNENDAAAPDNKFFKAKDNPTDTEALEKSE